MSKAPHPIETDYTEQIICPYCGNIERDAHEFDEGVNSCNSCGKDFSLEVHTTIRYTTMRITTRAI